MTQQIGEGGGLRGWDDGGREVVQDGKKKKGDAFRLGGGDVAAMACVAGTYSVAEEFNGSAITSGDNGSPCSRRFHREETHGGRTSFQPHVCCRWVCWCPEAGVSLGFGRTRPKTHGEG